MRNFVKNKSNTRMGTREDKRYIIHIFMLLWGTLLVSCSQDHDSILLNIEKFASEKPDSAWQLLSKMDKDKLEAGHPKALFGLLYTSTSYICQKSLDNDSLIDYSIRFFNENGDFYHLANSYYYKGAVNYDRKRQDVAVVSLKQAESLAIEHKYSPLENKIYELLSYVNYDAGHKQLTLAYSKKYLYNSMALDDKEQIARALTMVASSLASVGMPDSAYSYITRRLHYMDGISPASKADLLVNVGEMYFNKKMMEKAKRLASESDSIFSNPHAKMLLGKIYYHEGDTQKAKECWEEALDTPDVRLEKRLYKMLASYYAEAGEYNQAYTIALKLDSLKSDKEKSIEETQQIQLEFDKVKSEANLYKRISYLLAAIFTLGIALVFFLRQYKRLRNTYRASIQKLSDKNTVYESRIKSYSEEISKYEGEIGLYASKISYFEDEMGKSIKKVKELHSLDQKKQKEIEGLNAHISTLYQSIMTELRRGCAIYESIKDKKTIVSYSDGDLNALIDFYKVIKLDVFSNWERQYQALSVRQYLFLILEDLGYADHDIASILGIAEATVRSTKSRIRKKKK